MRLIGRLLQVFFSFTALISTLSVLSGEGQPGGSAYPLDQHPVFVVSDISLLMFALLLIWVLPAVLAGRSGRPQVHSEEWLLRQYARDNGTASGRQVGGSTLKLMIVLAPALLILFGGGVILLLREAPASVAVGPSPSGTAMPTALVPPFTDAAFVAAPAANLQMPFSPVIQSFVFNPWDTSGIPLMPRQSQVMQQMSNVMNGTQFAGSLHELSSVQPASEVRAWYDAWLRSRNWCQVSNINSTPGVTILAYKLDPRTIFVAYLEDLAASGRSPAAAAAAPNSQSLAITLYAVLAQPYGSGTCL